MMSLVQSILASIRSPKNLWDKLIKTVAYLKNCNLSINNITLYELANNAQHNTRHLKVVDSHL